jgi:hypothetical protein
MRLEVLKGDAVMELDELSRSVGNNEMIPGLCIASALKEDSRIIGFANVRVVCHAGGSYVHPDYRLRGLSYRLRESLENALREEKVTRYFAIPGNDFERDLFRKYGPVEEKMVQIKCL